VLLSGMTIAKSTRAANNRNRSNKKQVTLPFTEVMRLHTEVSRELKAALERACLERKLEGLDIHRQSDVVEEAVWNWLIRQGHVARK